MRTAKINIKRERLIKQHKKMMEETTLEERKAAMEELSDFFSKIGPEADTTKMKLEAILQHILI